MAPHYLVTALKLCHIRLHIMDVQGSIIEEVFAKQASSEAAVNFGSVQHAELDPGGN